MDVGRGALHRSWLTMLMVARRALNDERDWTSYLLHVVMTGLGVAVALNLPVAPGRTSDSGNCWLPLSSDGVYFGYLAAYWHMLPAVVAERSRQRHSHPGAVVDGTTLSVAALALVCVAPFRNWPTADARPARAVKHVRAAVVESLGARPGW